MKRRPDARLGMQVDSDRSPRHILAKEGGEAVTVDGKYMTILQRQPDGSWKIHRDIVNSNVP